MSTPPKRSTILDRLTDSGCFLADDAVLNLLTTGKPVTGAERTRVAVATALDQLEAQGYITFVDHELWPQFMTVPPRKA